MSTQQCPSLTLPKMSAANYDALDRRVPPGPAPHSGVNGWMHGSMGGGIGAVIGILVIVLLVVVIINQSKK